MQAVDQLGIASSFQIMQKWPLKRFHVLCHEAGIDAVLAPKNSFSRTLNANTREHCRMLK